jgi:hypothetical protein
MPQDKRLRTLTVTNRSSWPSYRRVPEVRLSGEWLRRAGFSPGCIVAVAVENDRLVVTVEARPKPLPSRRRSERQFRKSML